MDYTLRVKNLILSKKDNKMLGDIYTINISNSILFKKDIKNRELVEKYQFKISISFIKREIGNMPDNLRIETDKMENFELAFKFMDGLLDLEINRKKLLDYVLENHSENLEELEHSLENLEEKLIKAIELEDYDKACLIRDKINNLKI